MLKSRTTMNEATRTKVSAAFDSPAARSFPLGFAVGGKAVGGNRVGEFDTCGEEPLIPAMSSVPVRECNRRAPRLVCTAAMDTSFFMIRFVSYSYTGRVSTMNEPTISTPAPRGRPRSEHSHRAILEAANEILEERGFVDLTMDEVAQRGGVSKATIYRWWPTKGMLVFEAFTANFLASQPTADTGSLRGDLLVALRSWIRTVKGTVTGRTLVGLIAEVQRDPDLAQIWRERFVTPVRAQHRLMLDRAIGRGEVSADADSDVVLDLLFGSAYHRLLQSHLPLTDRFAQTVVDTVILGVGVNGARVPSNGTSKVI
jgi:AcrR family transcriptional regulator